MRSQVGQANVDYFQDLIDKERENQAPDMDERIQTLTAQKLHHEEYVRQY
jgi:hypothetical protein